MGHVQCYQFISSAKSLRVILRPGLFHFRYLSLFLLLFTLSMATEHKLFVGCHNLLTVFHETRICSQKSVQKTGALQKIGTIS